MPAQHIYTYDDPPSERDLERAVRALQDDGVIAYPTDANWAFGCDAWNPRALDRVHALKPSHPKERPFAMLVSSISMAAEYVSIDNAAYRVLKRAWPGPYTVLLSATRNFPRQLKDKRRVVGIRIPKCAMLLELIDKLGHPLATTSVPLLPKPAGASADDPAPAAHFGYEIMETFGHALDIVLDLGTELPAIETTIIDFTSGVAEVVRVGAGDPKLFIQDPS